jgi:hypothetical protein
MAGRRRNVEEERKSGIQYALQVSRELSELPQDERARTLALINSMAATINQAEAPAQAPTA